MPADPLSLSEREEIRAGIAAGESLCSIAARLGRHRCTVSAEVARNGGRHAYRASAAERRAIEQRARPKTSKLLADRDLGWHVTQRLLALDSPMTISIELARGTHGITAALSHESIYRAVYAHGRRGLPARAHRLLHRKRRCRKRRLAAGEDPKRPSPLGLFNPISTRPAAASGRSEVGHLEGDLICGAYNASAILTLFDRATRQVAPATRADVSSACSTAARCRRVRRCVSQPASSMAARRTWVTIHPTDTAAPIPARISAARL